MAINPINNIDNSGQNLTETIQKMSEQAQKDQIKVKPQRIDTLSEEEEMEDQTEETGFDVTA